MAKAKQKEEEVKKDQRPFEERLVEILEQLDKREVGTDVLIASLKADFVQPSEPEEETDEETTA